MYSCSFGRSQLTPRRAKLYMHMENILRYAASGVYVYPTCTLALALSHAWTVMHPMIHEPHGTGNVDIYS